MSRWEFMRQLEELLSDIAPAEREEALQYYNDYFNDAGRENEQEVIASLGTPVQVAQIVKDGLFGSGQGEFTETGFVNGSNARNELVKHANAESGEAEKQQKNSGYTEQETYSGNTYSGSTYTGNTYNGGTQQESTQTSKEASQAAGSEMGTEKKESLPTWAIVLIVIACIIFSPVILGFAGAVFGAIVSLVASVGGILLAIGAAAIVLFIVAIALLIAGVGTIIPHPFAGLGLLAGGLICGAIGILFMILTVLLFGKGIPAAWQGIKYLWDRIFDKKKGAQA